MTQQAKRMFAPAAGKEPPEWVAERMTTSIINKDGSFEIETSDGEKVMVMKGMAVCESANGYVFATAPARVAEKLEQLDGRAPAPPPAPKQAAFAPPKAAAKTEAPVPARPKPPRAMIALGVPPVIEWIAPDRLQVDDSYQRSIEGGASQKLINKIGMEWDWRLCITLIVSRRDSGLFVIDGQHRLEGARLRTDIQHLPCAVYTFDTAAAEAELFVQANRSRRPMQRLDEFHAGILAGDEKTLFINNIVTEAGLFVGRSTAWQMIKPNEVVFVGGVGRVGRAHGREVAISALRIIAKAFEGQSLSSAGTLFDALTAMMVEQPGKRVDEDKMAAILGASTMAEWRERVPRGETNGFERTLIVKGILAKAYAGEKGAGE